MPRTEPYCIWMRPCRNEVTGLLGGPPLETYYSCLAAKRLVTLCRNPPGRETRIALMWQPIDPVRRHQSEAAKGHLEGGDHARPRRSPGPKWSEAFWPLLRRKELSKGVADHLVRAPPGESRLAVWRPRTPKPKPSERPCKSRCGRLLPVNTPGPRDAWTVSSRQWSCPSKLESGTGKLAMRVAYLSAYWAGPPDPRAHVCVRPTGHALCPGLINEH